jgi:hypothetical protein
LTAIKSLLPRGTRNIKAAKLNCSARPHIITRQLTLDFFTENIQAIAIKPSKPRALMIIVIYLKAMLLSSEKEKPVDEDLNPQTDPFETMYFTLYLVSILKRGVFS